MFFLALSRHLSLHAQKQFVCQTASYTNLTSYLWHVQATLSGAKQMQSRMAHMHDNFLNGCDVIMLAHPIRSTQPASELAHRAGGVCAIIRSGISGGTCRQQDSMASCWGSRRGLVCMCTCCSQNLQSRGPAPRLPKLEVKLVQQVAAEGGAGMVLLPAQPGAQVMLRGC